MEPASNRWEAPRHSRRHLLKMMGGVAAAIPAMSALSACSSSSGGGDSVSKTRAGATTLTLAYLGDATQQAALKALFSAFNKAHPAIGIQATGIAAGDTADVRLAAGRRRSKLRKGPAGRRPGTQARRHV